jgi:type III pantothenate kinase
MNLCIDWGNSRTKVALFDKEKIVAEYNFRQDEALMSLKQLMEDKRPDRGIVCSVADHPTELIPFLEGAGCKVTLLNSATALPIMNAYHSPESLGADRLALAVASWSAFPGQNSMAISIGTAITYNFVQKSGIFRGGAISPGVQSRLNALYQDTDRLPQVKAEGELLLLGYDTETGIRSGVLNGIRFEIEGMIEAYKEQYSDINITITGGDAGFFEGKLKSQIFADSKLLMKGLNLILEYNAR